MSCLLVDLCILDLNVLTTYVKLERIWFLTRTKICYGFWYSFAQISMQYRYSLNKKQRKKNEKKNKQSQYSIYAHVLVS